VRRRSVIFSPEARNDLLELYDWIADSAGPRTAIAYIERLEAYCLGFEVASERGHRRDDLRSGLRVVGFEKRITIVFTVKKTQVTILRLLGKGRNWEAILA
jgi:toxin ParE1/3/4